MDYLILATMGFIAAITPGPDIFYVIRQGLCKGKIPAYWAVFGILSGNIIYLLLVAIVGSTLSKNLYFQLIIGFLGAIYLFKIAYLIFNDTPNLDKSCDNFKGFKIYKEALLLNLSNPKAMIFFAVVITPFMAKSILLSLASLFIGISLAFLISAFISSKIDLKESLLIAINKTASILFVGFAILLLNSAYKAFKNLFL
jgi:threonine/homoserine/homoserine lactone efflux protein